MVLQQYTLLYTKFNQYQKIKCMVCVSHLFKKKKNIIVLLRYLFICTFYGIAQPVHYIVKRSFTIHCMVHSHTSCCVCIVFCVVSTIKLIRIMSILALRNKWTVLQDIILVHLTSRLINEILTGGSVTSQNGS